MMALPTIHVMYLDPIYYPSYWILFPTSTFYIPTKPELFPCLFAVVPLGPHTN